MMYETRKEAETVANGSATIQVEGGYQVVTWSDYFHSISEEAESLYDGGWRSTDKLELMQVYDFDEEHAETICEELEEIENE